MLHYYNISVLLAVNPQFNMIRQYEALQYYSISVLLAVNLRLYMMRQYDVLQYYGISILFGSESPVPYDEAI